MFPLWALIAVGGHLANGVAFIIDKSLLSTQFKRPTTYAGTVGLLGLFTVVLLPFGVHIPTALGWLWSIIAGVTFVLALFAFFSALSKGEATRVVPIIGSLIPLFTLIGTVSFLHERFTTHQWIGFIFLILATIILAGGKSKHPLTKKTIATAIIASLLFAVSSVSIKAGYESEQFLTTFTISRIFGALTAIALFFFDQQAQQEAKRAFFSKKEDKQKTKGAAGLLILIGQSLGAIGFVLVQYAINLGSASIVNALQAIQYTLLVLVAILFAKRAPTLLGEEITMPVLIQKTIAIILVAIGLWYVV